MNKLIIPLLAASALLGGCHHATVRHTVTVPVGVVEHRHVVDGVVVVHQHEGDYRAPHHHDHYDRGRVVVVTPPPRVEHRVVTVIGHDGRGVPTDRGHHATPPLPPRQQRPQPPSQHGQPPLPPQHGRPQVPTHPGQAHPQPQRGEGRGDTGSRPRGDTTPSHHGDQPPHSGRPGGQDRGHQQEAKAERGKPPSNRKEKGKTDNGRPSKQEGDDNEEGHERGSQQQRR